MKNIVKSTEPTEERGLNEVLRLTEPKARMLRAAAVLAQDLRRSGTVVFTRSGFLAYTLVARGLACRSTPSPTTRRCSANCCCPGAWSHS